MELELGSEVKAGDAGQGTSRVLGMEEQLKMRQGRETLGKMMVAGNQRGHLSG